MQWQECANSGRSGGSANGILSTALLPFMLVFMNGREARGSGFGRAVDCASERLFLNEMAIASSCAKRTFGQTEI
jgi:hypothetical protein